MRVHRHTSFNANWPQHALALHAVALQQHKVSIGVQRLVCTRQFALAKPEQTLD